MRAIRSGSTARRVAYGALQVSAEKTTATTTRQAATFEAPAETARVSVSLDRAGVSADGTAVEMAATGLLMLLDGIDVARVRRPEIWRPKVQVAAIKGIDISADLIKPAG